MDQAQLQALIPPRQQNPLLKRKPLQLGTTFTKYLQPDNPLTLQDPLFANQVTLLYFASGWCNISKPFTKRLAEYYQQINLQQKKLEIIFISMDKTFDDYQDQIRNMPWIGVSYSDPRVAGLKEFYSITTIPTLLLVDHKGELVSKNCRQDVYELEEDLAYDKWKKQKQTADSLY